MRICTFEDCDIPVFGTDKKTGEGYCKSHQYLRTDIDRRSAYEKSIAKAKEKKIKNQSESKVRMLNNSIDNKLVDNIAAKEFAELQSFYQRAAHEIYKTPVCAECGSYIPVTFYRAATAHVLPKRKTYGFPSVACNDDNYLILGATCGCHNRYDRSWEDAAKMKVWPMAVEKFKKIYPFIDKSEYKNIPEVFLQEIEPK